MWCVSSPSSGPTSSGLDKRRPAFEINEFHDVDLADPESIDRAVASIGGRVDALFNVAGVSSGIGDPPLVVTINFLGLRHVTEALIPRMADGVVHRQRVFARGSRNIGSICGRWRRC